jgi:hypothetical protein
MVVLSDPGHIRQLFKLGADSADTTEANLGRVMGPNSLFALSGDRHRAQRKLLTPPFHGRRLAAHEAIVEREAVNEFASWPHDRTFATMPSMMRIRSTSYCARFSGLGARSWRVCVKPFRRESNSVRSSR